MDADQAEFVAVAHLGGAEALRGVPARELGMLPLPQGGYALAWRALCPARQPPGDWLFGVDSGDVQLLERVRAGNDYAGCCRFPWSPVVAHSRHGA